MTTNDILEKKFERAAVGGYKADDVNSFMVSVAETIEQLEKDKTDLQSKLVTLAEHLEQYRSDEESMRSALLGAQKLGDQVIKESKDKSERMIENASREAETIIDNARAEADRIRNDAKIQLDSETYALNKMKREVIRFKKQLMAMYKQHISLIEALPSEEGSDKDYTSSKSDLSDESGAPKLSAPITTKIAKERDKQKEEITAPQPKEEIDFEPLKFGDGFRIDTEE